MFLWSKPAHSQRGALCGGSAVSYLGTIEHASTVDETGRWV